MRACVSGSGAGSSSLLGFWLHLGGSGITKCLDFPPYAPLFCFCVGWTVVESTSPEEVAYWCRGVLKTRLDVS